MLEPAHFAHMSLFTFDFASARLCTVCPAGTTTASTAVPVQQAMSGCVAPQPAPQPLQQQQAVPSQAVGVTGPSAAPAQATRPNHQAAKPALQHARSQGGTNKRGSPATRLRTTASGVSKPTPRPRQAGTGGSGVSKPTRRQTAVAPRRGAASRGGRAAGSTRRGRTGKLESAFGTQPCRTQLLCLMLQPYTLLGVRGL